MLGTLFKRSLLLSVVLVSHSDGYLFENLMDLESMEIDGHGVQLLEPED